MIKFVFSIIFVSFPIWSFYEILIKSLFIEQVTTIYFDPMYMISFLSVASASAFILLPLNVLHVLRHKRNLQNKFVAFILLISGFFGMGINYANSLIISNKNYIQCPSEIGYKKNLLRNYVKDIRQCETLKKGS